MRKYEQPDINVVAFEAEDVIKTSIGIPNVNKDGDYTPKGEYGDNPWL